MESVFLVGGMALATFGIRYLLLPLSGRVRLSEPMQRALAYVPPAVLTAIIVPATLIHDGQHFDLNFRNPYLMGAVLTGVICRLSRSMLVSIVGGMGSFALWQWLIRIGWV
jgi:branched-subunit amino acid transport protein